MQLFSSPSLIFLLLSSLFWSACSTVAVYDRPIAKFQTAVQSANDSVRPYLLEINNLIAEANLYDKAGLNQPWDITDLNHGLPEPEIQLRIQAFSVLNAYATALSGVADSKDLKTLHNAADSLGTSINTLHLTAQHLQTQRSSLPASSRTATQPATLDLARPISSLLDLAGSVLIDQKQKNALERAIIDAHEPISQLIDLLDADLANLSLITQTSCSSLQTGIVNLYNHARASAAPAETIQLVDRFMAENRRIQTLRSLRFDPLLSSMKRAHLALLQFAKSSKSPRDLSELSSQIDVFTGRVQLLNDAIQSISAQTR